MLKLTTNTQVKPYHDWSEYYDTRCFVRSGEMPAPSSDRANCNLCESLTGCEVVDSVEALDNLTDLINNHRPTLVFTSRLPDADHNPIFNLTLDQLASFYLNLDSEDRVCMFESNLNFANAFHLMSQLTSQSGLFAHFENCGYPLRKKLRKLYDPLDFMPMMLEFTRENWFLLSQHYKTVNFKRVSVFVTNFLLFLLPICKRT